MAITVVGTATAADTGSATVDTITVPAGVAAGDGLLLFFGYASGAITTTLTDNGLSTPLTQVGTTATFSGHQSQVWSAQNLAAADAGKVITMTQSTGVRQGATLIVYRGVSRTGMVNAFAPKTSTVGTTTPSTPTVATTVAGCVEIGLVCATRGASTPQIATITPPAGSTIGVSTFSPAAGAAVTAQAVASWEGHNLTAAASGATVGGDTYTTDAAAAYSAWVVALAPLSVGPIVDAGADQTLPAGAVTLTGSETPATGTTITARAWTALTYPGTTAPTLTGATTATATFTAVPGIYTFRYRVTDSAGIFNDATTTVNATTTSARPSGTPSAGSWTATGATTIHGALADESDTTWAQAPTPTGSLTVDLPPAPVGAKTITYRLQMDPTTPGTATYLVEYLNGGTGAVIASKNETVTTGILAGTLVLSDTQNANLTNPITHQLRFTATAV
jgi:hypothetical protein